MSLTKPIPKKMREELVEDPFMQKCCLSDFDLENQCDGRIEWHHNLIFASNRINEKFCILPVCHFHHVHESVWKQELNQVMVDRATYEELKPYSKAIDYVALKKRYEN